MSIIRAWQPAITRIFPHQGNKKYLIPNRRFRDFITDPDVTMAFRFTDGTLDPVAPLAGPALTFTRGSVGAYYDKFGVLQTAAIDAPRFDHDPADKSALGLLIEEGRTNDLLQSENMSAVWNVSNTTVDDNQAAAPDNALSADRVTSVVSVASGPAFQNQVLTLVAATTYAFSVYAKPDQTDWIALSTQNFDGSANGVTYFNVATGELGTLAAGHDSYGIERLVNGWYRCWIIVTLGAVNVGNVRLNLANDDLAPNVPYDGSVSVFFWGAQIEAGAFPTSYIATLAVPVTRGADKCFTLDVSWLTQGIGTVYVKWDTQVRVQTPNGQMPWQMSDGGQDNRIQLQSPTLDDLQLFINTGGVVQVQIQENDLMPNGVSHKVAAAYNLNDVALYRDGTQAGTDGAATIPIVTRLDVGGNASDTQKINGHIAELAYANVRKTNTFLQQVTQ